MRIPLVAVIGLAVLGAIGLAARQQNGSIAGRVVLFDGSAAPGVSIIVTAPGVERRTVTDGGSRFAIEDLPPAIYRVRAELRRFRPETHERLAVVAGRATQADFLMRMSVFAHVRVPFSLDIHETWPREMLWVAETVAHLRIVERLDSTLLGPDCHTPRCPEGTFVSTRHAATVLALAKSSPDVPVAIGDRIEFWQLLAGEWRDGSRRIAGPHVVFAPGEEVVAFLRHDAEFGAAAVASPLPNLVIRNGGVYGVPENAENGLRNGMRVGAFLAGLN